MMIDKEEQRRNIDQFTADLLNAVLAEGVSKGVSQKHQEAAREAFQALARAAKSIVGTVPAGLFASACITYGEALDQSLVEDEDDGPRQVYEGVDEHISAGNPKVEDEDE